VPLEPALLSAASSSLPDVERLSPDAVAPAQGAHASPRVARDGETREEGDDVARKSSARIGASAAGGAIIGAIFGGQKGAAIGAAAGAGAGSAVTASQNPSEARFRALAGEAK